MTHEFKEGDRVKTIHSDTVYTFSHYDEEGDVAVFASVRCIYFPKEIVVPAEDN